MPEEHRPRSPHRLPWFWIVLLVVLLINWGAVLMTQSSGQTRAKVPFSPYFLNEVDAGNVASISSEGDTIQGTFSTNVAYPPGDPEATHTTLFSTEVPASWDNTARTKLLQVKGVVVNARNPGSGTSLLG